MPNYIQVEHNSTEWYLMRLGVATSSSFKEIVQPSTGKASLSRDKKSLSLGAMSYLYELLGEKMEMTPEEQFYNYDMERGHKLEPEAVDLYEFKTGMKTEKDFVVLNDNGTLLASPDRLVGDEGLLEVKCPKRKTHVKYMDMGLEALDKDYKPQYQGQLMVSERKFVDIFSYYPSFQPVHIRIERDEEYIDNLREALDNFIIVFAKKVEEFIDKGFIIPMGDSNA